jgi:hypothetical protein
MRLLEACKFVCEFYSIDIETCRNLYWDEVLAYLNILNWKDNVHTRSLGNFDVASS